jgi:hypothetical protein
LPLPLPLLLLLLLPLLLPCCRCRCAALAFPQHPPKSVISTEATHGLIVSSGVERPPHFAFAVAVACSFVTPLPQKDFHRNIFKKRYFLGPN